MWSEVGVSSSSVASGDHLDHGHDLAGEADLGEAHALGQLPHRPLVLWEQEGVLQHHRQTGDAGVQHLLQQSYNSTLYNDIIFCKSESFHMWSMT